MTFYNQPHKSFYARQTRYPRHVKINRNHYIIRPADKGSGIVVVDREEYIKSLEEEMENSSSYEETDYDKTEEIHKK